MLRLLVECSTSLSRCTGVKTAASMPSRTAAVTVTLPCLSEGWKATHFAACITAYCLVRMGAAWRFPDRHLFLQPRAYARSR